MQSHRPAKCTNADCGNVTDFTFFRTEFEYDDDAPPGTPASQRTPSKQIDKWKCNVCQQIVRVETGLT